MKDKLKKFMSKINNFLFGVVGGFTSIILYIPYDILFN